MMLSPQTAWYSSPESVPALLALPLATSRPLCSNLGQVVHTCVPCHQAVLALT